MSVFHNLQKKLHEHGQEHLLQFWEELDSSQQTELRREIESIDFDLIGKLHRDLVLNPVPISAAETIAPLQGQSLESLASSTVTQLRDSGLQALREGKVAAFLVAGGQGTRLGHNGPKGMFDVGLPSKKSLFQLQAERLLKLSRDCGPFDKLRDRARAGIIPWYIMTSRENHEQTMAFFESHDFFGLDRNDVAFFMQGELPLVGMNGKILMEDKGRISSGPNGNGGCFPALKSSGALDDMKRRGVEWVFVYSVDNALTRVCDPLFTGFAMKSGLPTASKAVTKASPEERVGVFCLRNGRPSVLEYSEMTPEMSEQRDANGGLVYGSANIATHLFRRDFLEANAATSLPYHVAFKKNACKFELFMFDLFPKAEGMAVLEVHREEEFAPVKNRDGVDSPATARDLILKLHRQWAIAAGFTEKELEGLEVEVSPLTSYAGEGLTRASFHRDPVLPLLRA